LMVYDGLKNKIKKAPTIKIVIIIPIIFY